MRIKITKVNEANVRVSKANSSELHTFKTPFQATDFIKKQIARFEGAEIIEKGARIYINTAK